jgi:hypothetical protein
MGRFYFGPVCLVFWRLLVSEWAKLSQDLGNFMLLYYWIYYMSLWLAPLLLLQCPWFSGLVFWWSHWVLAYYFHSSWVVWLRFLLFFSLISILSLHSEILSSTCSSLLEWSSTVFFVWLKGLFISRISVWFFFLRFFHIFVQLLYFVLSP